MSFEEIVQKIQTILVTKKPVVVAVSGFGGSGKTTLAGHLKDRFDSSTLLQLDNFLINHGEGSGWQGGYDWQRFEGVLKDVRAGKDLHYQWYDWQKDETKDWVNQPLPALVIVEGVRLFQPSLIPYFDLSIWIDKSLENATEQGKERDRANKSMQAVELETHIQKWDKVWTPKEEEFVKLFNPAKSADAHFSY